MTGATTSIINSIAATRKVTNKMSRLLRAMQITAQWIHQLEEANETGATLIAEFHLSETETWSAIDFVPPDGFDTHGLFTDIQNVLKERLRKHYEKLSKQYKEEKEKL